MSNTVTPNTTPPVQGVAYILNPGKSDSPHDAAYWVVDAAKAALGFLYTQCLGRGIDMTGKSFNVNREGDRMVATLED